MKVNVPRDGFIPLSKFEKLIDISKAMYYYLSEEEGVLTLKLYDKGKKLIKPYEENQSKAKKAKTKKQRV